MKSFWEYQLIDFYFINIKVYQVAYVFMVVITTRILVWMIRRYCNRFVRSRRDDTGRAIAIVQLSKYLLWTISLAIILEILGIKWNIVLAGSAALLVGLGLGINQLFNDIISGVVLLFEGTVSVGDIVEIEELVGRVDKIDLRTSNITSRDGISIIVPNSKLVSDKVINWSHSKQSVRFSIKVGVRYGSDTLKVKKILENVMLEHVAVQKKPEPFARFVDFGESSLDFEIHFFSYERFLIEQVKSDLRFKIDAAFRAAGIEIPFPQRDIHIKDK